MSLSIGKPGSPEREAFIRACHESAFRDLCAQLDACETRHEENRAEYERVRAELHKVLAELAESKRVRAALLATRTFWPLHLREAVERGDTEACAKEAIRAEEVVKGWQEDSVALRDLMRMAVNRATGLRYSYRCVESETLIDTVLADYKAGGR